MESCCSILGKKAHAVCIPLPFQSHINAMLKLAKLLYSKGGFCVTFVNTEFNNEKIVKSRGTDSLKGLPDFHFKTIPDGLPPCDINASQEILAVCGAVEKNLVAPFRQLVAKLNQASESPQVSCIISDGCMSCPLEVAEEVGIPGVVLWTMSAAFLMSNLHCQVLLDKGLIPIKDKHDYDLTTEGGYLDMPIDFIPGLSNIRLRDLPTYFVRDDDPSNNFVIGQIQRVLPKASALIVHTFDALESEVLEAFNSLSLLPRMPPIYTIGPLQLLLHETISNNQLSYVGSNFWKEDEESLKWLDSKQPNSVLYVNFGSVVTLTSEQLVEFAWGIANSKHPFLWVVRSDILRGKGAIFPPEFIEETAGRGMMCGWCPQEELLCHSSTGGFLTHSGWNSTMDTICGGVPIISWPFIADQQMNCRYACAHWDIGTEIHRNVKRDEVEGLVRELMEGAKGEEMRTKSNEWKKNAQESTKPGGTSYQNLDRIMNKLLAHSSLPM